MKVMANIEVDVPDLFVKNGEPNILVVVYGLDENGLKSCMIPANTYIFTEDQIVKF